MAQGGQRVVIAALAVNLLIAAAKLVAALISRSSAMYAEAFHSLADSANQIFLLIGMRKSTREADAQHPFGYGTETYFWAFIVAICIFAVGGGVSVLEGMEKILHRHDPAQALRDPRIAVGVLVVSIFLEAYSFKVAWGEFTEIRAGRTVKRTLKEARDPTVLTVLFEDLAALFGLVVALAGVLLTWHTGESLWDGLASVIVGGALIAVASVLARDAKGLLIGRAASLSDQATITRIVGAQAGVLGMVHARTMHFGPEDIILALKVRFSPGLTVLELEKIINELEARLRAEIPALRRIYVEPGFDESLGRTLEPA